MAERDDPSRLHASGSGTTLARVRKRMTIQSSGEQGSDAGADRPMRTRRMRVEFIGVLAVLTVAVFFASRLASPAFPSKQFLFTTVTFALFMILVGFGQGLVILGGGIDLSVASMVTLGAFTGGVLTARGWNLPWIVIGIALVTGIAGALMGAVVAFFRFPAFVVTMAFGSIIASALLGLSGAGPARAAPSALQQLFSADTTWLSLPPTVWLFVGIALLGVLLQHRTMLIRRLYGVGNSIDAARVARLPIRVTQSASFALSGAFYGLAGMLLLGYSGGASLSIGNAWLLPSIAVVVVGGSSMRGGEGRFVGTIFAALLLTMIQTDIGALGLSEGVKQSVYGFVILFAMFGTTIGRR